MKSHLLYILLYLLTWSPASLWAQTNKTITVGAKHFNESYILGNMIALVLEDAGYTVNKMFNLGGTAVTFEALKNHEIDVYPEYTGTIAAEILKLEGAQNLKQLRKKVKERYGLAISDPYGFSNTYALLMKQKKASRLAISTISDLRNHPDLSFGLSYEFLKRQDGWGELSAYYKLPQHPIGMEHGLAYQAILKDQIDVTDAYSTDGQILRYHLLLLKDDRHFFPDYQAVSFYNASLPKKAKDALKQLDGAISAKEMQALNARALFEHENHLKIARDFLVRKKIIKNTKFTSSGPWREVLDKTLVHLELTLISLLAAILIALPLGMVIYRNRRLSRSVLYIAGIMQTIPSIALLALMIPLFGIGFLPAIIALFIYALLPILRNTVSGLFGVDPQLKKVASAIGLNDLKRLKMVELPLAMPTILAGIRTSAVISVGTATLAAFIGAGGLGEFIVTGLALNSTSLILKGAIPAALLAIAIELLFEGIEWLLIPRHLRQKT